MIAHNTRGNVYYVLLRADLVLPCWHEQATLLRCNYILLRVDLVILRWNELSILYLHKSHGYRLAWGDVHVQS